MLDQATVLTTIFTMVDDTMKGSPVIQQTLERPGPAPRLSDSEVVTIALYQELIGGPREDHFFLLHRASLRTFFPGLNERSRYNRRKRELWSVILAVRVSLQLVLDALALRSKRRQRLTRLLCRAWVTNEGNTAVTFWAWPTMGCVAAKP